MLYLSALVLEYIGDAIPEYSGDDVLGAEW
jgi:hypothetical protein